eukprot:7098164-Ditylum_brightwellii.AAC.1
MLPQGQSESNTHGQASNALPSGSPGNNIDNITDSSASSSGQESNQVRAANFLQLANRKFLYSMAPFLSLPDYQEGHLSNPISGSPTSNAICGLTVGQM